MKKPKAKLALKLTGLNNKKFPENSIHHGITNDRRENDRRKPANTNDEVLLSTVKRTLNDAEEEGVELDYERLLHMENDEAWEEIRKQTEEHDAYEQEETFETDEEGE